MQSTTELQIGDVEYKITTFPASKGLAYLQKLLKIVGPAIGEIFANAAVSGTEAFELNIEDEALSAAIRELTVNMDKDNVAQLVEDMITAAVLKNGQPLQFNQEFSGNYGAMIKIMGAIIKENYSSFFGESGFGELQKLIPQPPSNKK